MSSPDRSPGIGRRAVLVGALALTLGGCLRPLYGPTASGARMQDVLAEIEVDQIRTAVGQERTGHYLRSELIYNLDGSGRPRPKRFKAAIRLTESVQTPIVDTVTGRANSATLLVTAVVALTSLPDNTPVLTEVVTGTASYDRFAQRFANIRAARDAEIRLANTLADQIRTRLAIALSNR